MEPTTLTHRVRVRRLALLLATASVSAFFSSAPVAVAAEAAGALAGRVSNTGTGALLQGATVEIPALGVETLTNNIGEYVLHNVPAGQHEVVVRYIGLDPVRQNVTVTGGQRSAINFDLSSEVYQLEAFTVSGEREGNAASITRQRNAPNVKHVVALDAFGNLPNDSAGELLIRLPGIAGNYDDEGNVTGVSIRGMAPGFNTVSVDGNQQASAGGFGRDFRTHNISGALFEEIEVTKSPTPDMPADSLGGSVNLKTRSPLSMKEKRRISYRAAGRWAPSFYDHTPLRRDHPIHPLLSLGYQEVFSVFGGERNLGVSLDLFYSENVNAIDQTLLDYQFSTESPAYVYDYRRQNGYNNRVQQSAALKFDYKVSDRTRVFLNTIYNEAPEKFNRLYTMRAFTGRNVAAIGSNGQPTGNNAILPGWTADRTQVRGVNASIVELNSTLYSFFDRQRQIHAGAVHEFERAKIDYDVNYSHSKPLLQSSYRDNAGGGIFTMQARNVGWVFDKSGSAFEPSFTQTEGPSIYDPASYGNGVLTSRNNKRYTTFKNASANAQFELPTAFSSSIKTGVRYKEVSIEEVAGERRWNYIGAAPLSHLVDPTLELSYTNATGRALPFIDSARIGQDIRENPLNWQEDVYYREMRTFAGTRSLTEEVQAAYIQGQARLGKLSVVGGVRFERTEFDGEGYVASLPLTTTAQRAADPIGSAHADYNNHRVLHGKSDDFFPGLHFVYRLLPNLQARLSWSNSIGRPPGTQLLPTESVNLNTEMITLGNPNLKPQTSENWDLSLEYYFEPVGQFSVGYFRKDVADFLVTRAIGIVDSGTDNGFGGDYAGYTIQGPSNAGEAKIDGFEFNYQQQFTFLPGVLRGFGFSANYTKLETSGDYGETGARSTTDVARFTPETANAALTYSRGRIGGRVSYNYMGKTLWDYSSDPSRLRYRDAREMVNVGMTYQVRRGLTLSVDLANVFNSPQEYYRALPDRLERATFNGTTVTFGVSGRF